MQITTLQTTTGGTRLFPLFTEQRGGRFGPQQPVDKLNEVVLNERTRSFSVKKADAHFLLHVHFLQHLKQSQARTKTFVFLLSCGRAINSDWAFIHPIIFPCAITSLKALTAGLPFTSVTFPPVLSYPKKEYWETCLNEFSEGNGIISICVSFLDGPVSNAPQLVVWDVYTNHHPQNLVGMGRGLINTNRKLLLLLGNTEVCFPINTKC